MYRKFVSFLSAPEIQ